MIYQVKGLGNKIARSISFGQFLKWFLSQYEVQLDLETTVAPSVVDRKLVLIQFGDSKGKDQYLIRPKDLLLQEQLILRDQVLSSNKLFVIHNATFEYQTLRKYGIRLKNVYDTLLVEKSIYLGYKPKKGEPFYSLAAVAKRRLFLELDKSQQTTFTLDALTDEQILYAATDVKYLSIIKKQQIDEIKNLNKEVEVALENDAVKAFAEIEYNGMVLNQEKWLENLKYVDPIIDSSNQELTNLLLKDFKEGLINLGYYNVKDTIKFSWNQHNVKKKIIDLLLPNNPGSTKAILSKWLKDTLKFINDNPDKPWPMDEFDLAQIEWFIEKRYDVIEDLLLTMNRDWLIEEDLIIPAETLTINWNSPKQRLEVFKLFAPGISNTNKETLSNVHHPIINAYKDYIENTKLKSSFGEKFIKDNVDSDGRVRTRFDQLLVTGRVSSSNPKSIGCI